MSTATRPPLTDSPWFWLYVFATAGVLALLATSSKFGARQSQLDRQFEGRRHAVLVAADEDMSSDQTAALRFTSPGERIESLRPLYALMMVAIVGGWIVLWWQRFRPAARGANQSTESTP
ncbi:MAG: hypothetical protein U0939_22955 [Pirellulales bacterium]